MSNFYGATGLIGGNSGDLDNIDGTNLATADGAFVVTSTAVYVYYLNATSAAAESSPDIIQPDANGGDKRWILVDIIGEDAIFELLKLYDTDKSHTLSVKWNEDDSGDRVLNVLVAGGDRSLTLNENLTVGDGGNVTITSEDAAGSITLDNASLEVEDTVGSGNTIKFVIGTDDASRTVTLSENLTIGDGNAGTITFTGASKTLSVEDDSVVNQDLTTDASPTFGGITTLTSPLSVANGGSGAATLTDGGILLGSGTGAITAMSVLAAGAMVVGDGATDPAVLAAGATTEILVGGGAASPVWTTATGTGAPVRGTAPTLTAATLAGTLSCADNLVARAQLIDYSEDVEVLGSKTASFNVDFEDGNVQTVTLTANAITVTFTNPPASGDCGSVTLICTNAGLAMLTWTAVDWEGGTAPDSLTSSGVDILVFWTVDAATTVHGAVVSLDSK